MMKTLEDFEKEVVEELEKKRNCENNQYDEKCSQLVFAYLREAKETIVRIECAIRKNEIEFGIARAHQFLERVKLPLKKEDE